MKIKDIITELKKCDPNMDIMMGVEDASSEGLTLVFMQDKVLYKFPCPFVFDLINPEDEATE